MVVREDYWEQREVPNVILRRADLGVKNNGYLVEGHEQEGLAEKSEAQVLVEVPSRDDY